jgi:pre-mRNA-splicing factor SPF27
MTELTRTDIDGEIPPENREALLSLIRAEHPSDYENTLHPAIPESWEPDFSPLILAEHERISKKLPMTGIDVSRYEAEALEAPERTSPHSDENNPELLQQWRETLQRAYSTSTYLSGRNMNLSLLETYGKNAWLIGNAHLEKILKDLELDLVERKKQVEQVEQERYYEQDGAKGEMEALEQSWKKGIRGIVEVELATEGLRMEILERRKAGAG